jgi:hypothetical protein
MWCRHCQQDVPAARDAAGAKVVGPPACSRCRQAFVALPSGSQPALKLAAVADCGVSLEEFDRAAARIAAPAMRPKLAADSNDMRRLERVLRPRLRSDFNHGLPLLRELQPLEGVCASFDRAEPFVRAEAVELRNVSYARRPRAAWGVNLLLTLGAMTFACGVGLLIAANMLAHALAWRWGFALTIVGEGLLIGGLAAMAVRLWRNSRRMTSQLEVIDRRLGDVQASVGNAGEATMFSNNALWRVDASGPLRRFERAAAAAR